MWRGAEGSRACSSRRARPPEPSHNANMFEVRDGARPREPVCSGGLMVRGRVCGSILCSEHSFFKRSRPIPRPSSKLETRDLAWRNLTRVHTWHGRVSSPSPHHHFAPRVCPPPLSCSVYPWAHAPVVTQCTVWRLSAFVSTCGQSHVSRRLISPPTCSAANSRRRRRRRRLR